MSYRRAMTLKDYGKRILLIVTALLIFFVPAGCKTVPAAVGSESTGTEGNRVEASAAEGIQTETGGQEDSAQIEAEQTGAMQSATEKTGTTATNTAQATDTVAPILPETYLQSDTMFS